VASLKDIATALDLSVPLVSKVLSGKMGTTGCSEANRQAIFAKAAALGFRPNPIARALRTGRTGSLGIFIHPYGEAGSELNLRFLSGLSEQSNICNQRLWLSFYETDRDFLSRFTKSDRAEIDGLLVAGVYHPRLLRLYKAIESNGIPVVALFKRAETAPDGADVYCDEFQIGYLPTRQLLEQGCRKIAHIHSLEARYQGYLQALEDFGLKADPALVYRAIDRFGINAGREAVQHWLANGVRFDGLVAESDHQAYGGILELLKQGIKVPDDVKVFGVDDSPLCSLCPVPISSVSQQPEEAGRQAVKTVMKRIRKEPVKSVVIQPVLSLRASTGN
jgi:LacI family transcriptional regulator